MKKFLYFFIIVFPTITIGQQLTVSIYKDPAYCRTTSMQNGNGVLSASASGGSPGYTYKWTNLQTNQTVSTSTMGALNPGAYEVKVWDANNDSVSQVVTLDSINPIADFTLVSNDVDLVGTNYIGFAPATIDFVNQSTGVVNPNNLFSDTTFFWHFGQYGSTWVHEPSYSTMTQTYNYGGTFYTCLVAVNKNGCKDTTCHHLGMFGTAGVKGELPNGGSVQIIEDANNKQLLVQKLNYPENLELRLYNMSGQLLQKRQIINSTTYIPSADISGMLIYEFIDPKTSTSLNSDKIVLTQN